MARLALTFDDGPSGWSESIAEIVAANGGRATFFVIGSQAEERADLLRQLADEGHEIGNHTWSHPWLARDCDDGRVRDELVRTNDVLAGVLGRPPRRFRAPHYDVDERVAGIAAELGLEHTRGDITPPDWLPTASAGVIATLVLARVRSGAVIGLHDGVPPRSSSANGDRRATADAVAALVPRLRADGYELVTASELLG
jgi:peptidoglycan/xylan/chitin deacetylase (PgdA/CDA1 family)